jgi:hypothetical protein
LAGTTGPPGHAYWQKEAPGPARYLFSMGRPQPSDCDLGRALHEDARGLPRQVEQALGSIGRYKLCVRSDHEPDATIGGQCVHHVEIEPDVGLLAWSWSPVMLESAGQQVASPTWLPLPLTVVALA